MASPFDVQLWDACSVGDLDLVKSLCLNPSVSVVWKDPEHLRTPFYRACFFGHLPVIEYLLQDPRIDVNVQQHQGCTPFYVACWRGDVALVTMLMAHQGIEVNVESYEGVTPLTVACEMGHTAVVLRLLANPNVDVNLVTTEGSSPFLSACDNGFADLVRLFLADPRVSTAQPNSNGITPLWMASQNGHLEIVQLILVSEREANLQDKSTSGTDAWNDMNALEVARWSVSEPRDPEESDEEYALRSQNCPAVVTWLEAFEADPEATRRRLRQLPHLRDPFISDTFALLVFLCDGLLTLKPETSDAARFFQAARRLPLELQMVLCNRMFGSRKDIVLIRNSEPAFKRVARQFLTKAS